MAKILYSHRDGVRYLEHCRIVANDKHVSFVMADESHEKFFNIPHANIACLLLGPGTSITQRAAFHLAEQGVMIAFTGGGGTPLFFASQNEYRPTEFLQRWYAKWSQPANRLEMAKVMQEVRCTLVEQRWSALVSRNPGIAFNLDKVKEAVATYRSKLKIATANDQLMGFEANFVKALYKICADALKAPFSRNHEGLDPLNQHLNSGNYLAYGLAGSALWILGIPHSLPVSHGMTRRGALVFDVADIIKDAFVLPSALTSAALGETDRAFRNRVVDVLHQHDALKILLTTLQDASK